MGVALKPEHLRRYKDIVKLLLKYGHTDLIKVLPVDDMELEPEAFVDNRPPADPEELAQTLEEMGPTFIKLGQLLSTRPDIISDRYLVALSRLQDRVAPFSFDEARQIIEEELGVRLSKAFPEFNPTPIAAASLSQVHYAQLRDGREVAIKVQRPAIRKVIFDDLEALTEIVLLLEKYTDVGRKYPLLDVLDNFRRTLMDELDFQREASNLKRLKEIVNEYETLLVPVPIDDFTTSRVLTMDYIRGVKVSELSPVASLGMDRKRLAEELSEAYLDQILVHGFLHADPHPGNVLITPDGKLALIDLGMVAFLAPKRRDQIIKLLLAINDNKPEDAARLLIEIGTATEGSDENNFISQATEIIQHNQNTTVEEIKFGQIVMQLIRAGAENGIQPAPELTMTGKALLSLDQITLALDPDFNPEGAISEHIQSIMRKRLVQNLTPAGLFSAFLESYELVQKLPGRINTLFDKLVERELEIKIHVFDEQSFMANLQKIGNRIAMGLVLAALIVGAALTMQISSPFMILGYPAISTIMFGLAAFLGFFLVIRIIVEDLRES